jgi:hypothetical protein
VSSGRDMIELFVEATHLYPGARGLVGVSRQELPQDGVTVAVAVIFSDGMTAAAELAAGATWTLHVAAYRTAAGTAIAAKSWTLDLFDGPDRIRFRTVRRLPADGSQTA